tara:strand:+ start:1038 stop:1931 length:894 start_codon:yes stop_codon:yes gene_type:complete
MNKKQIINYFESLKNFLSNPDKKTLKNLIRNSLIINKNNKFLKQTGGNDICAICHSNKSPFGEEEEEMYSHIREEPFYRDNKFIITNCKLHKSCLEQYIKSKYNGPDIEGYPIKCPVCNSAHIYSKIVNVKEEGTQEEKPVFQLVTLDNLNLHRIANRRFNMEHDARANLNAIIITAFFIIVSYFILQYRNQIPRITESNINSEQEQINELVNNYISELFQDFQNSETSFNEESFMQMIESLNERIEDLLLEMQQNNDLPELSEQLGGKKYKKKAKKTKKLKKIKSSKKKSNKMIKK